METPTQEPDRWRLLLRYLDPNAPVPNMQLYVKPKRSASDPILRGLRSNPDACPKFLLVGARGVGKSSEMRAVLDSLGRDEHTRYLLVSVDLDQSGLSAGTLSAFDLLYVSALALLKCLPRGKARKLFTELKKRYAPDKASARALGSVKDALGGLAAVATSVATLAKETDLTPGMVPLLAAGFGAMGQTLTLRLLSSTGVVSEQSPRGRQFQDIVRTITQAAGEEHGRRNICLFFDGLEKIWGSEHLRELFVDTGLLADAPWSAVIAAPACALDEVDALERQGFRTATVFGFGPDDLSLPLQALERRIRHVDLELENVVEAGSLERIVEACGGTPRHAITMLQDSVERVIEVAGSRLSSDLVKLSIRALAEVLGRGLNEEHLRVLATVHKTGKLPGVAQGAYLFSDGHIIAMPPEDESPRTRFVVHPLLKADVERQARELAG